MTSGVKYGLRLPRPGCSSVILETCGEGKHSMEVIRLPFLPKLLPKSLPESLTESLSMLLRKSTGRALCHQAINSVPFQAHPWSIMEAKFEVMMNGVNA